MHSYRLKVYSGAFCVFISKNRGGIFMIRTIQKDGSILDLEENNEELNKILWHTTSHILAQAVKSSR